MKKTVFLVMMITILSKILGFVREVVLSYTYGASGITDAYLISQTVPYVIFGLVGAGVATGFIPMYSRVLKEQGLASATRFTNNLSNTLLLLASTIILFVFMFTEPIVKLLASGFTGDTLELTVRFTRISVFGVYFTSLCSIFVGYVRLYDNYVVPALVGVPMNFIVIACLLISRNTNTSVMVIGTVLATASQFLLLIPVVRKTGYRYQPVLDFKDENLKKMVLVSVPVIVGISVNEINVLVDRALASGIATGGISALSYANRLNDFVQGLFVASITIVMYPMISKAATERNITGLKTSVSESISIIGLLVMPATVGAMVFSREIVVLLFGRGAFTSEAIEMTSSALFYYSSGMIAFGLRDILSRAFYALQDTKTPMMCATISAALNITLNLILSRYMGIGGLALATSVSAIIGTLLLFVTLRKKIGGLGLRVISISFLKIGISSCLMGIMTLRSFRFFEQVLTEKLALLFAIGAGVLAYGVLVYLMRIPTIDRTIEELRKKLRRGRV